MQKKFITNLSFLLFLNLLIKPFYILGIDAEIQKQVGAEVYGNYFTLMNFSFLLNIFLDLGLTNFNTRNIARHSQLLQKQFPAILSVKIVLVFLYTLITLCLGLIIGFSKIQLQLLGVLLLNQFFVSLVLFFRSNLSGLLRFKEDSVISILDRLLLIIFCSILIWGGVTKQEFKIEWFIYGQTVSYAITAVIAFLLVRLRVKKFYFKVKPLLSLSIIKQSLPFAVLVLLMTFYNRLDAIMLERMLVDGKVQAGIYAQGFRLLDAANMLGLMFAGLLLPLFSTMIKNSQSVEKLSSLSFRVLIVAAFALAIPCFFYAEDIMNARYNEYIAEAGASFSLLILSFIFISISYIFGTLLTANGSLKQLNLMSLFGVVFNLILNFIFIPTLQSYGAALATLITQAAIAILQLIYVQYIFKFKVNYGLIFSVFLTIIVAIYIGIILKNNDWFWFVEFLLLSVTIFIVTLLLRVITPKRLVEVLEIRK